MSLTWWQLSVVIWAFLSILIGLAAHYALVIWMYQQGIKFNLIFVTIPRYVSNVYLRWCQKNAQPKGRLFHLYRLAMYNLTCCAVVMATILLITLHR